jgi:hypothetical protein
MGPYPRGGAYTYDWIENLLGLNMHSVDTILPDYQHPQVGEGFGYGANKMSFAIVEPEHVLAIRSADGNWVWTFVLTEQDGKTRLISRNRFRLPKLKDKVGMIPMEPGSLVMERKMLLGIKQRAERLSSPNRAGVSILVDFEVTVRRLSFLWAARTLNLLRRAGRPHSAFSRGPASCPQDDRLSGSGRFGTVDTSSARADGEAR